MMRLPPLLRVLRPDYVWPCPTAATIASETPPLPKIKSYVALRFWGLVHEVLECFSPIYAKWTNARYEPACQPLPFGLVLKRTTRVRLEEVIAMQLARHAGMPVPKVISYGEHSDHSSRYSILMTRMPGSMLSYYSVQDDSYDFEWELESPWMKDLGRCLNAMRTWRNPHGRCRVSSVLGTSISTTRVPRHRMGPFDGEFDMLSYLQSTASSREYPTIDAYEKDLVLSKKLVANDYGLMFSHGDFMAHNILIDDEDNLTAILDWECAGWYPKYWEFTTVLRMNMGWWAQIVTYLGGDQYLVETEYEKALARLTWDSYVG